MLGTGGIGVAARGGELVQESSCRIDLACRPERVRVRGGERLRVGAAPEGVLEKCDGELRVPGDLAASSRGETIPERRVDQAVEAGCDIRSGDEIELS